MVHMILAFHSRYIDHQKHDSYNDKRDVSEITFIGYDQNQHRNMFVRVPIDFSRYNFLEFGRFSLPREVVPFVPN
jgi:hypothetical protein